MARIWNATLTASGNSIVNLTNHRGCRNIYTVHIYGTFGSGTVTVFTNPEGAVDAAAGTTNDIAVLDSGGTAISKTAKASFDFECNSDPENPIALKFILSGATNPSLRIRVDNVA